MNLALLRGSALYRLSPSRHLDSHAVTALRAIDDPKWAVVAREALELAIGRWGLIRPASYRCGQWVARAQLEVVDGEVAFALGAVMVARWEWLAGFFFFLF